ncbi:hypothetical protein GN958_ATG05337 [Phytophthora infestans]|uniref:Uncharacterized protein n=1 Tax=Phytophthora infestans TaxID=4787 RepID=A0A8S9UY35_PHYIN|nr:hypothetical protein GN958_ATG05334 [Phytophthora infestans]KAF4145534.1 hypothetical protein GN958_ATG05337 [Phytophthora infestans]
MAQPSLSPKSVHVRFVIKLPVYKCEILRTTTSTSERSPASSVGVTNVKRGFFMPLYGKEGGSHKRWYRFHTYSCLVISSACF